MFGRTGLAVAAGLLTAGTCLAQSGATVVLNVDGVKGDKGQIFASLCDNPKGGFPGNCPKYQASVKTEAGRTTITFKNVPPGTYAPQVFHDENGNGRPEIPPEGYAYGNDVSWPATFDAASTRVSGDTTLKVTMQYMTAPGAARQGSKGAPAPAGVTRIDVREKGLYGELYIPEGGAARPAIILLGGSEGGLDTMSMMATSFAKNGYAALALAYWAEEGLPQTLTNIPLEYFDTAVSWLKARPDIDDKRGVGVIGWSRGSEAALLLGSRNKDVRAVVAIAPSGIVWDGINFSDFAKRYPAWTVDGKGLPSVATNQAYYRGPNAPMAPTFTMALPDANRRPETAIPVEKTNGPILLISGLNDNLWPASQLSDRVIARLQGARFRHSFEHLAYAGAGHVIFVGEPDGPMSKTSLAPNAMMGGTPEANRKAWEDNWPKALAFYDKALKGGR